MAAVRSHHLLCNGIDDSPQALGLSPCQLLCIAACPDRSRFRTNRKEVFVGSSAASKATDARPRRCGGASDPPWSLVTDAVHGRSDLVAALQTQGDPSLDSDMTIVTGNFPAICGLIPLGHRGPSWSTCGRALDTKRLSAPGSTVGVTLMTVQSWRQRVGHRTWEGRIAWPSWSGRDLDCSFQLRNS